MSETTMTIDEIAQMAARHLSGRLAEKKLAPRCWTRHKRAFGWRQFGVHFVPGQEKPAIALLVAGISRRGWNRFLVMDKSAHGGTASVSTGRGVSVRAAKQWDVRTDYTLYRLDVIGARA